MKKSAVDHSDDEKKDLTQEQIDQRKKDKYQEQIQEYRQEKQRAEEIKRQKTENAKEPNNILFNDLPGQIKGEKYVRFDQFFTSDFSRLTRVHHKKCISVYLTTFGYDIEPIETLINCGIKVTINNDHNQKEPYIPLTIVNPLLQLMTTDKTNKKLKYGGCSHSKLWLIRFEDRLRIVIGSANLTVNDFMAWGQVFWYQDLFKASQIAIGGTGIATKNDKDKDKDFEETLTDYLIQTLPTDMTLQQFQDSIDIHLNSYSFTSLTAALVASVRGDHMNNKYGISRLTHLMARHSLSPNNHLYYQTSSTGYYNQQWLNSFLKAFQPTTPPLAHLIYPTQDYIQNTVIDGEQLSCILFMNHPSPLITKMLAKFSPNPQVTKQPFIGHSKVFLLTGESVSDDSVIYLGSHNFTSSAWGSIQQNG